MLPNRSAGRTTQWELEETRAESRRVAPELIEEFRRRQFMIERFQQFIRVSDEELRKYYDEVYAPEVRLRGERLAPFEEVTEAIRQNRVVEKMNEEVGSWLLELRRRSVIEKIPN